MGQLVAGEWLAEAERTIGPDGQFIRPQSRFRNWITSDGRAGPSGAGGFAAEPGRYHLYVSYACPWAHRALIYRSILGLKDSISISVVHPVNPVQSWEFSEFPGATEDHLNGKKYLHEIYTEVDPDYSGKVTVPVLWDKKTGTIVNNESSEIIRMIGLNSEKLGGRKNRLYRDDLAGEIEATNKNVYRVNNGVYRSGFAKSQEAYDAAVGDLFAALDLLETQLENSPYLVGDDVTECDWRLFTTAIRFDAVYVVHFKCSIRRYADYPNLNRHLHALIEHPGVKETIRMDHIRYHYFRTHLRINPNGIIPAGPHMDWEDDSEIPS
jgi:glutathionyl-hydroquinone reductase